MTGWDDLPSGALCASRTEPPLSLTDLVRYQGASGDLNPLHHDPSHARQAGLAGPVAVGMRQAGVLGTLVAETFGPETVRSVSFRFLSLAWPGDVLTYDVAVAGRRRRDGERLLDLTLRATRPDGSVHLTGTATVALG